MGDFAISDKLKEVFRRQNIEYYPLISATPEEFHKAVDKFKKSNSRGAFLAAHSVEEYQEMRHLFITEDGTAGIAITKDNNIVSVFNGGEKRGVLKTLLPAAIDAGGRKLDNYNISGLSALYELYGFNPISKTEFNSKFAPDDWNYARDGEPDIVFWIHNGDTAEDVILNFGRYMVPWDIVEKFNTYEEAEKYRDDLIFKIDKEK